MIPILSKVKTALRIGHTSLDTDILDTIDTAKAEMVRAGINPAKITESDYLITDAIKTYCKYIYWSDSKTQEGYFTAWQYQLDCLRKSSDYIAEVEDDV